jgi:ribosome maturation factor RimP
MRARERLISLIEPAVTGLGYEFVGVEFDGRQRILRIYIDRVGGITLDDCSKVSYQVSGVLDVEDPIPGRYQLEVSSPGLDRPLFALAHFERFKGEMARVQLASPLEGRRKFKARLLGVDGDCILLQEGETVLRVPYQSIEKARLAPEFDPVHKGQRHGE